MRRLISCTLIVAFVYAGNLDLLCGLLTQTTTREETYRIEPGDVLEIVILGEDELARTLMVMHNGTISFPLVGEVKVAGLTTDQASSVLAQRLERYFVHPVVSIITLLISPSAMTCCIAFRTSLAPTLMLHTPYPSTTLIFPFLFFWIFSSADFLKLS